MLRARLGRVAVCLAVAVVLSPRPAAAANSLFGDGNQAFDASAGSPDLLGSYTSIPLFKLDQMLNVWPMRRKTRYKRRRKKHMSGS